MLVNGVKMSVMAKTAVWTYLGLVTFWISLGLFAGAPWDGVLLACLLSAIPILPGYWYGKWLLRKLTSRDPNGGD